MGPPPPSRQPELSATWECFGNNKIGLVHLLPHPPAVIFRVLCRWLGALDGAGKMLWSGDDLWSGGREIVLAYLRGAEDC